MLKIEETLIDDSVKKQEKLHKLLDKQNELKIKMKSQEDILMEYRTASEEQKQISENIKNEKEAIKSLQENILKENLEISNLKNKNEQCVTDLQDVIKEFFKSLKLSMINSFDEDFYKSLEQDDGWQVLYHKVSSLKNLDDTVADSKEETENFRKLFFEKLKDFKKKLLNNLGSLKGTVYIETKLKYESLCQQVERHEQDLANNEADLEQMLKQDESTNKNQANQLAVLNTEVESLKKQLTEFEKLHLNSRDSLIAEKKAKIRELEHLFNIKQAKLEEDFKAKLDEMLSYLKDCQQKRDSLKQFCKEEDKKLLKIINKLSKK